MFYLINEKDKFYDGSILVNALNLKTIEVCTGDDSYDLIFTHHNDDTLFSFKPEELFNVDQVIHNISELKPPVYSNHFIVVTDIGNIENIEERFGSQSDLMHKATTILININDINLAYQNNNEFILDTSNKNFSIKESPEEIFNLIQFKIVPEIPPVLDTKSYLKTKL